MTKRSSSDTRSDHDITTDALLALHDDLTDAIRSGQGDDAERSALRHIDKGIKHLKSVRAAAIALQRPKTEEEDKAAAVEAVDETPVRNRA